MLGRRGCGAKTKLASEQKFGEMQHQLQDDKSCKKTHKNYKEKQAMNSKDATAEVEVRKEAHCVGREAGKGVK